MKRTTGMDENLGQLCGFTRTYLSPNTFAKVDDERPDDEPPAVIPKAVFCRVKRKGGGKIWLNRVTDEASGGMSKESHHKEECEVVGIPKNFKALFFDLVVRSGIH